MENVILISNSILILLGILFSIFGYLIYFKKKYTLINNCKNDKSIKKYNDKYALRIGLIEFYSGIIFILIGIVGFDIEQKAFSIVSLTACITYIIVTLIITNNKCNYK